jgi:predicted metal-dependent HD superfamily phosphohydrolase
MKPFSASYSASYHRHWRRPASPRTMRDFVGYFTDLLTDDFAVPMFAARCTAASVYYRMIDPLLTYHNPVHVLATIDFAHRHNIAIRPWEKLALLFHDVIYDPFSPHAQNEKRSAAIAVAMMTGFSKVDLSLLESAILATAQHASAKVDKRFHLLLDLDVCAFAWDRKNFVVQSAAVAGEFIPTIGKKKWAAGRDKFLRALLAKGPIFRSPAFKRFEKTAQQNIRESLG